MKSELLSYVLKKAEALQREADFAELTATHFLSAALLVLDEVTREEIPAGMNVSGDEIASAKAALADLVSEKFGAVARLLAKSVEDSDYDKKKDGTAYATAAAAIAIGEMYFPSTRE